MSKYIAVKSMGVLEIHAHAPASGAYMTLCCLDGDDPNRSIQQAPAEVPRGAKIDCPHCIDIIRTARQYTEKDIAK